MALHKITLVDHTKNNKKLLEHLEEQRKKELLERFLFADQVIFSKDGEKRTK